MASTRDRGCALGVNRPAAKEKIDSPRPRVQPCMADDPSARVSIIVEIPTRLINDFTINRNHAVRLEKLTTPPASEDNGNR